MNTDDKIIIGLTEIVTLQGASGSEKVLARIDTGATKSSIDLALASKLNLGPVIDSKLVKSAHGSKLRPVIEVTLKIKGQDIKAHFTLADRSHMKYKVLVGQNVFKEGFLIDPSIKHEDKKSKKKDGGKSGVSEGESK